MSQQYLIYTFDGDPEAFYNLLTTNLHQYDMPNIAAELIQLRGGPSVGFVALKLLHKLIRFNVVFRWILGWLIPKEPPKAELGDRALSLYNDVHRATIIAYRYGNNFYISATYEWVSPQVAKYQEELIDNDWRSPIAEIEEVCFNSVVRHLVKTTLKEYVEDSGEDLSPHLDPETAFAIAG